MPISATTTTPGRRPLGALAAALALAAAAPTQQAIYALLDDPSGNPVQGATGWLTEERRWQLQAL
ncbi:MAG: hypothetical protein KAI24_16190, partial [Planctomycetes bacterium]|nr:hypothetical protein [Planctomycetota bacterium]